MAWLYGLGGSCSGDDYRSIVFCLLKRGPIFLWWLKVLPDSIRVISEDVFFGRFDDVPAASSNFVFQLSGRPTRVAGIEAENRV